MTTVVVSKQCLLHRMVPEHFHASRLFRRLVESTLPPATTQPAPEWRQTYMHMVNADTDIDYVFSTRTSSRTVTPPLSTATPPPSPSTVVAAEENAKVYQGGGGGDADSDGGGDCNDAAGDDSNDVFQRTYWRNGVNCVEDLRAMVDTMVLWGFDDVPAFVWEFCESAVAGAPAALDPFFISAGNSNDDNKFLNMLSMRFGGDRKDTLSASLSASSSSLVMMSYQQQQQQQQQSSRATKTKIAAWAQAYPRALMEDKQFSTLALLHHHPQLDPEHVLSILDVLVQDRDHRLVAALLRLQSLPRALPLHVHQFLSEFHGGSLALCALRNPEFGNPAQTVALAATAMTALLDLARHHRRRHNRPHYRDDLTSAAAQRYKSLCASTDDLWVAAAAVHGEQSEILLQKFMDLGADPCSDTDRLAMALCVVSATSSAVVLRVVQYHDYRSGGTGRVWARAAVRCKNLALLQAFVGLLLPSVSSLAATDDDDDGNTSAVAAAAEAMSLRLQDLVQLCAAEGAADCLAFLLAWTAERSSSALCVLLRQKAARVACLQSDEMCLHAIRPPTSGDNARSDEEEEEDASFQFTVEDTDTVFLATLEKVADYANNDNDNETTLLQATVRPYVYVRAHHSEKQQESSSSPLRPRRLLSAVVEFLGAWVV